MRRLLVLTVLSLACGSVFANQGGCEMNVESEYDLALNERSVILTRDSGVPKSIVMRQGRLFVDDAWVDLSPADTPPHRRVRTGHARDDARSAGHRSRCRRHRVHHVGRTRRGHEQ